MEIMVVLTDILKENDGVFFLQSVSKKLKYRELYKYRI